MLVIRGPEGADDGSLGRASQRLALLEATHGTMWLPESVQLTRGHLCWVFPEADVLALSHVLAEGPSQLPLGAAVTVVARVAESLAAAGPIARQHRGPTPYDLLVDPLGRLRLAGFIEPVVTEPAMVDPTGDHGEASLVYRLGVLLSWLATGAPPEVVDDPSDHEAAVRRALIRIMSRPGPVISERFANWFRALRTWEPTERPPLARISEALTQIAEELGTNALLSWATRYVSPMLEANVDEVEDLVTFVTPAATQEEERTDPSLPPRGLPRLDDHTQESSEAGYLSPRAEARPGGAFGMPVRVGPPPEAVKQRPALPAGFLDSEGHDEDEVSEDGVAAPGTVPPPAPGVLVIVLLAVISLGLIGAATLLLAYLLEAEEEPAPAPRIGEVLGGEEADTRVLVVRNPSGANLLVTCGQAETRTQGDAILNATEPNCIVTAELDGEIASLSLQVAGIAEVSCFDGEPTCTIR